MVIPREGKLWEVSVFFNTTEDKTDFRRGSKNFCSSDVGLFMIGGFTWVLGFQSKGATENEQDRCGRCLLSLNNGGGGRLNVKGSGTYISVNILTEREKENACTIS